jgi:hypothetical protein
MAAADLRSIVVLISQSLASIQRDVWAIEMALRKEGILTAEQIASARASVGERLKDATDQLNQESAERMLDMLRNFEGPPQ